jgi:acyl-CoA synthetase (AMP-forming)/AMP-acid ligase II
MLSYAHGACDEPLLGETIGANLDRTIARVPQAEALVSSHQGLRYTYSELGEAVDRLAGGILAAGLRPGDRVGVWGPNRAEWVIVQYARAKVGVILVNINPAYRTSELVPDERYGEELMAWVVPRAGVTLTEEDVREFCRGKIAHFKIPRYVKFVDSFPMTVTGKVQKFRMRETAIEEFGLGQAAAIATA